MKQLISILILSSVVLSGCAASSGNAFDINVVSTFVPGETTYAEAVTAMGGAPTSSARMPQGAMLYTWVWSRASVLGANADGIVLLFDSNGVFVREESRTSI